MSRLKLHPFSFRSVVQIVPVFQMLCIIIILLLFFHLLFSDIIYCFLLLLILLSLLLEILLFYCRFLVIRQRFRHYVQSIIYFNPLLLSLSRSQKS